MVLIGSNYHRQLRGGIVDIRKILESQANRFLWPFHELGILVHGVIRKEYQPKITGLKLVESLVGTCLLSHKVHMLFR